MKNIFTIILITLLVGIFTYILVGSCNPSCRPENCVSASADTLPSDETIFEDNRILPLTNGMYVFQLPFVYYYTDTYDIPAYNTSYSYFYESLNPLYLVFDFNDRIVYLSTFFHNLGSLNSPQLVTFNVDSPSTHSFSLTATRFGSLYDTTTNEFIDANVGYVTNFLTFDFVPLYDDSINFSLNPGNLPNLLDIAYSRNSIVFYYNGAMFFKIVPDSTFSTGYFTDFSRNTPPTSTSDYILTYKFIPLEGGGYDNGYDHGYSDGYREGYREGVLSDLTSDEQLIYQEGWDIGYQAGSIDGRELAYEWTLNGKTWVDYMNSMFNEFFDISLFGTTMTFGTIISIGFGMILLGLAIKIFLGG